MSNIKAKIDFHYDGVKHPFWTTQTYEKLSTISEQFGNVFNSDNKYIFDGEELTVSRITWEILPELMDLHINVGVDLAKTEDSLPYNFNIRVYFLQD